MVTSLLLSLVLSCSATPRCPQDPPVVELHVDATRGKDQAPGSAGRPLRSIAAAIQRLPDPVTQTTVIHLASGTIGTTGGGEMPAHTLHLMRRMRVGVSVRIVGPIDAPPQLAWSDHTMCIVTEGDWQLENVQIGTFATNQRRGIEVTGPAHLRLRNVTFRLRSESDAAIWARHGGRVTLHGKILINEHLHDAAEAETFSGLLATEHGIIECGEREQSRLELGNGSLSVRTYGIIRLGCESARITCWTKSNNLAVNNGGRIDVRNTTLTLCAKVANNTPIGLEHDGHILAEDAKISIVGKNDSAIALQKASTFTCNDIALEGEFEYAIWASSGSMFVGRFLGDVGKVDATTGAGIHLEKVGGEILGEVTARSGGVVSLPDRTVHSK